MPSPRTQALVLTVVTFLVSLPVAWLINRFFLPIEARNLSATLAIASTCTILLTLALFLGTSVSRVVDRFIERLITKEGDES